MKKIRILSFILCFVLLLQVCVIPGIAEDTVPTDDESVTAGCHTIDAQSSLLGNKQLIENTGSALLYDRTSDTMIHACNIDEKTDPASLVKIMTAWIAVDKGDLSEVVTIRDEVISKLPKDAVALDIKSSEIMTLKDLLYCMMVSSANDAAAIIADHISGSQEAFADLMNEYAQKVGCTNTHFTNPHGLPDEQQYSTARDLARILNGAMENEDFREAFGAIYYAVEGEDGSYRRILTSKNYLMNSDSLEIYYDHRVTGGRTGSTADDKRSVAASAKEGNMEVISIILGSSSVYEDDGFTARTFGGFAETTKLLDLGLSGYKRAQVIYQGQVFKQCPVANGESDVSLGTDIAVSTVIPANVREENLTYRYFDTSAQFDAPIKRGDKLSCVQIWYNGVCLAQTDLYAMNAVPVRHTKLYEGESAGWGKTLLKIALKILVVVLCGGLLVVIALRVKNQIHRASLKKKSRRNRMNRRRSR